MRVHNFSLIAHPFALFYGTDKIAIFCTFIFGTSTHNFELEQIEKYENCSFQYEILILETRLLSVFCQYLIH